MKSSLQPPKTNKDPSLSTEIIDTISEAKPPVKIKKKRNLKKILLIVIPILVILSAAGVAGFFLLNNKPSNNTKTQKTTVKPKPIIKYYSPLTGVEVKDKAATERPVTGVMIENSEFARPQSGLKKSGVVFEAIAEGGITRFLVLYQNETPQLIGPVRSVRMYYLDWAIGFNAGIAHVGGSPNALDELATGQWRDLDQFANADAFWRSTDRYAPHNVYTTLERLDIYSQQKGYLSSNFSGFEREPIAKASQIKTCSTTKTAKTKTTKSTKETDCEEEEASLISTINVNISGYMFNSTYTYDQLTNTYARSQAGEPHLDREEGQITPNVVIAMMMEETTDGYPEGYRGFVTVGSGDAKIFQNGKLVEGHWSKASRESQIIFTDASDKVVPLVRGQTWLVAVPVASGSVTWQ